MKPASVISAVKLMQFGHTRRYHTEICLVPQDVAQHSFNVAWLCWLLSDKAPSAELLMAALAHDAGERWTGDLPAPVKRALGLGAALDALESEHLARAGYRGVELSEAERRILKLADVLDGCFYCLRELKLGNTIMLNAVEGGAGLTFLSYLLDLLPGIDAPTVRTTAHELYDYLQDQYGQHRHHSHPAGD